MPVSHSMLHTFTKRDVFSAGDALIETQMVWPETEKTAQGPGKTGAGHLERVGSVPSSLPV